MGTIETREPRLTTHLRPPQYGPPYQPRHSAVLSSVSARLACVSSSSPALLSSLVSTATSSLFWPTRTSSSFSSPPLSSSFSPATTRRRSATAQAHPTTTPAEPVVVHSGSATAGLPGALVTLRWRLLPLRQVTMARLLDPVTKPA